MSSISYRVQLSKGARTALKDLSRTDATLCKRVALQLLALQRNPRPDGSDPLVLDGKPSSSEFKWGLDKVWIAYVVDDKQKTVNVGLIWICS